MKKKIIYGDDFLGDDVKVKVVKDFLPLPSELVLKKDFRSRAETNLVQIDSSMSPTDFRQITVA